jgi:hypothetical protein
MLALQNENVSYLIISSPKLDDMMSILYAKEYQILPIQGFYKGQYENSIIASASVDNDQLRNDGIFLLEHFGEDCAIIKYVGESGAKKLFKDGSEKPMGIVMYNTDSENRSFLHNGFSFSFVESKRYWKPKKIEDFRVGMIVEYFNNNKWYQKQVQNPSEEWEKMYKLLIKYDKLRVESK